MTTINRVLPRELPLVELEPHEPAVVRERALEVEPHHDPHLAHHFDSPRQQYDAAKFGMWLFLATEVLLFGGLFCLYSVLRSTKPEIFAYGSQFLQVEWGALNTAVLILSSLTMARAVRAAQLNQRKTLIALLALTILGGALFMGVKFIEYSHKFHQNLVWGIKFYDNPHDSGPKPSAQVVATKEATPAAIKAPASQSGDVVKGQSLWIGTCRSCHGVSGEGMPGQGKDIRGSEFIASKNDKDLVAFIKVGRMPFDKLNTTGIQMPSRGGNPLLTDANLLDIVAYVRTFKAPPAETTTESATGAQLEKTGTGPPPVTGDAAGTQASTNPIQLASSKPVVEFYIPKSTVPKAPEGPAGLAPDWDHKPSAAVKHTATIDPRSDPARPANVHLFFGVYFLMTGLHGLHVLIGMGFIAWLLLRAVLGHFTSAYCTPVDLVGLYWHVVDLIWIFLFPLLYLIH